jgi:putative Holliday junction resolvase
MLGRIVGLDVGSVRIGVAVSDPLGIMSLPHSVITRTSLEEDLAAVRDLVATVEAIRIVAGLPLNQEGKPGPQAEKVMEFLDRLREVVNVEIVTQDERFSTAEATRMLIGADVSRKGRKKVVDKIAAHHILETYLDRLKRSQP